MYDNKIQHMPDNSFNPPGAMADVYGSAHEQYGGLYHVAVTQTDSRILGLVNFPLQHIIKQTSNKRVAGRKRIKIQWYCPFSANDIDDLSCQLDSLVISHVDLYFLGTKIFLNSCYRSTLPEELLHDRFHSSRYKKNSSDGRREIIYRVPKTAFDSTFFFR